MSDVNSSSAYPVAMAILKAGVGFFNTKIPEAMETYLESLLGAAESGLAERGIFVFPGEINDDMLLAMYAEWLYRKKASGAGMPDMLRAEIRTRQVGKATK